MALMSMTGFGRARAELSDRFGVSVIVRSVNHRYLDIQVRTNLREDTPEIEAAVRSEISKKFHRGRVSAQVNLERILTADVDVAVIQQKGIRQWRQASDSLFVVCGDRFFGKITTCHYQWDRICFGEQQVMEWCIGKHHPQCVLVWSDRVGDIGLDMVFSP